MSHFGRFVHLRTIHDDDSSPTDSSVPYNHTTGLLCCVLCRKMHFRNRNDPRPLTQLEVITHIFGDWMVERGHNCFCL